MADFGGMSADQINASMGFGPGGVGAQGQAQLNSNFGNFGQQTDYYSGLGAAYGRNVGEPSGMGSVFDQSAYGMQPQAPFQSYGQPSLPSGGGGGVYRSAPGGGLYLDQGGDNPPTNASPSSQGLLGYTPSQPGAQLPNGFGYPGAMPPSQMFNPNAYAPAQQQSSSGGGVYRTAPGGGLYLDMSGGGGGGGGGNPPVDMNASDFSLLGTLTRLQGRPDLNTENMPNFGNLQNPGQSLTTPAARFIPDYANDPPPQQSQSGMNFGSSEYPLRDLEYPADTRGPGGRPSWMNPNPGGG
jgi:hypothetical protein